jgi:hypothetical protein
MTELRLESLAKASTFTGIRQKNYNLYIGDEDNASFYVSKYWGIKKDCSPTIQIGVLFGKSFEFDGVTFSVKLDWLEELQIRQILNKDFGINVF